MLVWWSLWYPFIWKNWIDRSWGKKKKLYSSLSSHSAKCDVLPKHISKALDMQSHIWCSHLSFPIRTMDQTHFWMGWITFIYIFTLDLVNYLFLCYKMVVWDMDSIEHDSFNFIDRIVVIGEDKQSSGWLIWCLPVIS